VKVSIVYVMSPHNTVELQGTCAASFPTGIIVGFSLEFLKKVPSFGLAFGS
jgi:hypothetical protein